MHNLSQQEISWELIAQKAKLDKIRVKFFELFKEDNPDETLDRFIKTWFVSFYGEDLAKKLKNYGLNFRMWEKCALFDLEDAGFNVKRMKLTIQGNAMCNKILINPIGRKYQGTWKNYVFEAKKLKA